MKLALFLVILSASSLLLSAEDKEEQETEKLERRDIKKTKNILRPYNGPCGYRYISKKKKMSFSKIVGGTEARLGEFPWQVAIFNGHTFDRGGGVNCGAVIIDEKHILTAAHCVAASGPCYNTPTKERFLEIFNETSTPNAYAEFDTNSFHQCEWMNPHEYGLKVIAGIADVADDYHKVIGRPGTQVRGVSLIFVPEDFYDRAQNDLAVLRLHFPLEFTGVVRPACLPSSDLRLKPGRRLTIAGFGTLSYGGRSSDHLMKAEIDVYPTEKCLEMYPGTFKKFCAGKKEGGVDTCQGDSGGPIGINRRTKGEEQFTVVGLVSYGYWCAEPDTPGAYTDLRYYLDFIERARRLDIKPVAG